MAKSRIVMHIKNGPLHRNLRQRLNEQDFEAIGVADSGTVPGVVARLKPNLVLIDTKENAAPNELELVQHLRKADRQLGLFLLPAHSSEALAIAALRAGVNDYLTPPFSVDEVAERITDYLSSITTNGEAASPLPGLLIGDSVQMQRVKDYAAKAALTDCNVLITGETGTGKELLAQGIHRNSARRHAPMVCFNCAAIPDALLESELYGYQKGAFTGASAATDGLLKRANGGTVFLDEIGDMSLHAQAKVLRAIESKEILPLGSKKPVRLDIRIIAATNQELESMVAENRFRKDLYFRLKVAHAKLPPLRDRKEDIPLLVQSFVQTSNRELRREVEGLDHQALAALLQYDWPGNVRELKNLIEASFITLTSSQITTDDLPETFPFPYDIAEEDEKTRLLSALTCNKWSKSKAALSLGWSRMTVYRKLAKYGIH
jgi:DNA-binding NtrC family response regulator